MAIFVWLFFFFLLPKSIWAQSITEVAIEPALDISRFSPYVISAGISDYASSEPVSVSITAINGDGGSYWNFYADGTPYTESLNFPMVYSSGSAWKKTGVYPDYIYPEIFFAPSSITWSNAPSNLVVRRNDYSLLHFKNSLTMTGEMNFWVEVNAVPKAANSADLQVYLVKEGKSASFFQSDWRPDLVDTDVELIGTISREASFHHAHGSNSSHHLIAITPNADGTIGANHLDVSDDFWIVLYNTSPNVARGWDLRYHGASLCSNTNGWYRGNQTGWTVAAQAGCPDVHLHLARRTVGRMDGVSVVVTAGEVSSTQAFYYGELPNLPPNTTKFINPNGGSYSGNMTISWSPASDPNGGTLTYSTFLLDESGNDLREISSAIEETSFVFDTTGVDDGVYGLRGEVCDTAAACVSFYTDSNFFVNNASDEIFTLNSVSLASSGNSSRLAAVGETVTLSYASSGTISSPTVKFYSAGFPIGGEVTTVNVGGNNWFSYFKVLEGDIEGEVSFTIESSLLDKIFFESTDGSYVNIRKNVSSSVSTSSLILATSLPPSCESVPPGGKPELFRVDVGSQKAKLFYSPVAGKNTSYYLAYGNQPNSPIYGAVINQGESSGVLSFEVNHLKPNTVYYFKIRGQNDCMPGAWSNELRVKTTATSQAKISFFKYRRPEIGYTKSYLAPKTEKITTPSIEVKTVLTPSSGMTPGETPLISKKKCFLFWCW